VGVQAANERAMREHTMLVERTQKMSRELQEQIGANTRLLAENGAKARARCIVPNCCLVYLLRISSQDRPCSACHTSSNACCESSLSI
jgi:hypothetical protein